MKSKFNWREAIITALSVLMLILFMAAVSYETAAASEVDLDPTAVLVYSENDNHYAFMTKVPVLNGTRYLVCMTTVAEWPALRCLNPDHRAATKYGATIWDGAWETTVAITTARSL